jgi:hypothetical protein
MAPKEVEKRLKFEKPIVGVQVHRCTQFENLVEGSILFFAKFLE